MTSENLKYGDYDFTLLPEISKKYWYIFAENGELPELPPKGRCTMIIKKAQTGVNDFPETKSRVILTADGKLRKFEDYDADRDLV